MIIKFIIFFILISYYELLLVPNSLYLEQTRPLQASVLRSWGENNTERIVVTATTLVTVEDEHARIGRIVIVAPAFEPWIASGNKVSVLQFNPFVPNSIMRNRHGWELSF